MQVFKHEVLDGLEDKIKSCGSVSIACQIHEKELPEKVLNKVVAKANPHQVDLFYFESILASVGWNLNDDVFLREEMIKARKTPEDKPVNFMHNETDIIGHMTSSMVVADGKVIEDDSDIPQAFDIVTGAVLYRFWEDKERREWIANLTKEIAEGKWQVSMECIYPHFDYAVITPDGQHKIIARNDDSSYLTKHLRVFGGSGEWNGNKVGRALRNFSFSAKGIVDNPANPKSDITASSDEESVTAFNGTDASISIFNNQENNSMSAELKFTQEQYDTVAKELSELKAKASETSKKEVEETKSLLSKAQVELGAITVVAEEREKAIATLKDELVAVKAELDAAKKSLAEKEKEKIKAERLAKLIEKGVDNDRALALVEKFVEVNDELFNELANAVVPAKADKKEEVKEVTQQLEKAESKELPLKSSASKSATDTTVEKASAWFTSGLLQKNTKK